MSPPVYDVPTRPCGVRPVVPVRRYAPETMRMLGHHVYQAITVIN